MKKGEKMSGIQALIDKFGEKKILSTGILCPATLRDYLEGRRSPRPITVIAVAQALGENWKNYV